MGEDVVVVVVGDSEVGKSCLCSIFGGNSFPEEHVPTVMDIFHSHVVLNNQKVRVEVQDTAGNEDFDRIRLLQYPRAKPSEQPPSTPAGSDKETVDETKKSSRKGGKKSPRGSASPKGGRGASRKGKKGDSAGSDGGKRSRSGSPKSKKSSDTKRSASGKGGKKGSKRSPSPAEVQAAPPAVPEDGDPANEGPPPAQPGDDDWECVKEPIDMDVAEILAPQWEYIEETYVKGLQVTFMKIRNSRQMIIMYLYQIREDFKEYLMRPDEKQAHVSQYQEDFNAISDDIRGDEETKSEWHERVFSLQELLWEISDKRKQSAEHERSNIMNDGWLPDKLGVLTNDYITIMQVELDKFYDTLRVLKDYYQGMEPGKPPNESDEIHGRLPLIEVPQQDGNVAASSSRPSSKATSAGHHKKSATSSERGKSAAKHSEDAGAAGDEAEKPKIPLVPRRPASADFAPVGITQPKKDQKKAGAAPAKKGGGAESHIETPLPPNDEDEKILFDAANFVFQHLQALMATEQAAREAEEEAERQAMIEKEKEKEKMAKAKEKGSKKGAKGSAGKKGPQVGKDSSSQNNENSAPSPTQDELTAQEMAKKAIKDKIRQEYLGALGLEEVALRTRIELIKQKGIAVIQEAKAKAEKAYGDMNDWLGSRFQHEMSSIDRVCEVMVYCSENSIKIQEELLLEQDEFTFHEDRITYKNGSPPPRPDPEEMPNSSRFTVAQLHSLTQQFREAGPSGLISSKAFIDIMSDLDSLTQGQEMLPEIWTTLSNDKLGEVAAAVAPNAELIDWKKFIVALSKPWPQPTQSQLLELLALYKGEDEEASGLVDKEHFENVPLWFKDDSRPATPDDPNEAFPFPRSAALKDLFFQLFAQSDPPVVDFVQMLLYFSADLEPVEGFLRALSVACQTHIPRVMDPALTHRSEVTLPGSDHAGVEGVMGSGQSLPQSTSGDNYRSQGHGQGAGAEVPFIDIPESAIDAEVTLRSFLLVLQHGQTTEGDSNRFAASSIDEVFSVKKLQEIWQELGNDVMNPIKFTTLSQHPHIQDTITACYTYKFPEFSSIIGND